MGRGAKENSSGSLPWGRGAHREGVLLVTEMTFTESWPALQSSRAPPTHTHTHSPHWPPEPLGAVLWKAVCWVRSSLASLSTASSHPDHHHSPLRKLIALRVLSSPQPGSSVAAPPQHLWETREIQPSAPPPPGGRSLLAAASAWAWGSAAAHLPPCSRALVGTLRTFVPRDPSLVPLSRPGYLLASTLAAVKGRLSSHHL